MLALNKSTLQYRHLYINCWLYVGTAVSLQTVKAILLVLKLKQTFTPPPKKKKRSCQSLPLYERSRSWQLKTNGSKVHKNIYSQFWICLLTMMMRWARRVRARKYTTRSLLGSLKFLKAGVCRVIVWGEGRGGGGTSRVRRGPGLGGGIPASAGRRRFRSAS